MPDTCATSPRLGFIGFGEAGPLIAKGLLGAGLPAPIAARDIRDRPQVDGVEMTGSIAELVGRCNIILSTVTATDCCSRFRIPVRA